jgi:L-amino acid N-acyltransferase YncA
MEAVAVNSSANTILNEHPITIQPMRNEDGQAVLEIYTKGIETKNATFETQTPTWEVWDANHVSHSRFVATFNGSVVGWSALTPYSNRAVYRGVHELSIYMDPDYAGKGIGTKLMDAIVKSAKDHGSWMLQASIFPEKSSKYLFTQEVWFS